jgi:hypothetical protein
MSIRPVKRLIRSKPTCDGAGVHLRLALGFSNTSGFDSRVLAASSAGGASSRIFPMTNPRDWMIPL